MDKFKKNIIHQTPAERQAYSQEDATSELQKTNEKLDAIHSAVSDKSSEESIAPAINSKLDELNTTELASHQELQQIKESQIEQAGLLQTVIKEMRQKSIPVELLGMEQIVIQGDKGDQGEIGIQGEQGEQGIEGERGEIGNQGFPGVQGLRGDKGERGEYGLTGLSGTNGKDGSPDTPEQVVGKIRISKEKISYGDLKNLPKLYDPSDFPTGRGGESGGGALPPVWRNSSGAQISALVTDIQLGSGLSQSYGSGKITITGTGGGGGSATTHTVAQTTHGFVVGDVIRNSGSANTYTKAQANSATNAEVVGIVTTNTDANNFIFTSQGIFTSGVPVATAGTVFFLSPSSAGALTSTEPTAATEVSAPLVVVLTSGSIGLFFNKRGMLLSAANSTPYAVSVGGTGATTLTDRGVLIGRGTGVVEVTSVGTATHVLTSNGAGNNPTFQAAGGGTTLTEVTVSITAANIIAMQGTPVQVLAAPGAGKTTQLISAVFQFIPGGIQFTGGADVQLRFSGFGQNKMSPALASSVDINGTVTVTNESMAVSPSAADNSKINTAIVVTNGGSAYATGNGTAKIYLLYRVVTI